MNAYNKKNGIEILANTDAMQIVRNKKLNIWQMVFYREGTFTHKDITVKVDKACALMLKDIYQSSAELHIADPAQSQSCIKVDVYIPKFPKTPVVSYVILKRQASTPVHPRNTLFNIIRVEC